jgi:hypothetical protein
VPVNSPEGFSILVSSSVSELGVDCAGGAVHTLRYRLVRSVRMELQLAIRR